MCLGGVAIEVVKDYDVRQHRGFEEVRTAIYRYTAHVPGQGNILRYDNMHAGSPDEFHRHLYDLATWTESSRTVLTREEMPTFVEILDEVQRIAAEAGLLDSE